MKDTTAADDDDKDYDDDNEKRSKSLDDIDRDHLIDGIIISLSLPWRRRQEQPEEGNVSLRISVKIDLIIIWTLNSPPFLRDRHNTGTG